MRLFLSAIVTVSVLATSAVAQTKSDEVKTDSSAKQKKSEWIQLFNGKDLTGWTPKIRYHKLGENFGNTFRVEDGVLKVSYDQYDGKFKKQFGHLFYKNKFSHYILRTEYRFVGKQIADGPPWARRNSGFMLHGEDPKGMAVDQDFPVSIEVQLLGGVNKNEKRTTLNLCTPGTNVERDGKLFLRHCTDSNSQTYHGEQWVTAEIEVRGSEYFRHKINGKVVLEYQKPQLDERDAHARELIKKNGGKLLLSEGTISLQSESHPCEFRKIELKVLKK
ncbi:MAG: DUF1080 domain-containing protein [Planctomycetaceae bacterium]